MPPFVIPKSAYDRQLRTMVRLALAEDIGPGDLTRQALKLGSRQATAHVLAKSEGVLAGADVFVATIRALDRSARVKWMVRDGSELRPGTRVAEIRARATALLSGERTSLNFLSRLSGVATTTRRFVDAMGATGTRLLDTRKTTPGWRFLEKRATMLGGAATHRIGLYDALMIKSNHVVAVGGFSEAVKLAVKGAGRRTLICEVQTEGEIRIALECGVQWLLLDHFTPARLQRTVRVIRQWDGERPSGKRTVIEVSGNVTLKNIRALARCGADYISSGAITHSAPAVEDRKSVV